MKDSFSVLYFPDISHFCEIELEEKKTLYAYMFSQPKMVLNMKTCPNIEQIFWDISF